MTEELIKSEVVKEPVVEDKEIPCVMVVTVVFNAVKSGRARELRQCLASVQNQENVKIEHLIVDGASKDGTLDLIQEFKNDRTPIRLFSANDDGIYHAMNRGIALARGKYVIFLNSDDYFHDPLALFKLAEAIKQNGVDFSYARTRVINEDGSPAKHLFREASPYFIFAGMTICHQTIMVKRCVLEAVGGFDRTYRSAADFDLLLRIMFEGYFGCRVDDEVVTFRLGGFSQNDSGSTSDNEVARIFKTLTDKYLGSSIPDSRWQEILTTTHYMPPIIVAKIESIARQAFGDDYRLSDEWCKALGGYSEKVFRLLVRKSFRESVKHSVVKYFLWRALFKTLLFFSEELHSKVESRLLDYRYRKVKWTNIYDKSVYDCEFCFAHEGVVAKEGLILKLSSRGWNRRKNLHAKIGLGVDSLSPVDKVAAKIFVSEKEVSTIELNAMQPQVYDIVIPHEALEADDYRLRVSINDAEQCGSVVVLVGLVTMQ